MCWEKGNKLDKWGQGDIIFLYGLVAQLGAHHIRIVGVGSSNLLKSTNKKAGHPLGRPVFCWWTGDSKNQM